MAIWTSEVAEYHGELVDFGPMEAFPKPVQQPHPPIHVGVGGPHGMRRAIRYGDAWMPIVGRAGLDAVALVGELREQAEAAGRDPATIGFTAYGAAADAAELARYAEAGIERAVFFVDPLAPDDVRAELDRLAVLVASA